MDSEECQNLPLFSHVTSMAITGLENLWDEFSTISPYRARFSEMPELEELSIVVHDLRWPGIEVKCPRLAVFELVIRPDPDLPGTTIDAYSILRFYMSTMVADGPTTMPAGRHMAPLFASGRRYEPRSTCPNMREIRFPSQTTILKSVGLQRSPSLNTARSDSTHTRPTPVYTAAETTEAETPPGRLLNFRNLASGNRGLGY
ncbi:hypothetical protein EXIGLDRAFT_777589 [Exidia glandulosa HHB12029]|uniref:Uncharacterized protein n=1 Tax=Exidia glandulosa HHB12029 TaxID=1314781 RepID=A0A165CYB6_EXIGL|nr:hypothetical protein EXIGLDRAFT_777589 [Exidia glandulosa HHB12029]